MSRLDEYNAARDAFPTSVLTQRVVHLQDCADAMRDELQAELAALKGRRCEACRHWARYDMWPDQGWCPQHNEMDADCSCFEWAEREKP